MLKRVILSFFAAMVVLTLGVTVRDAMAAGGGFQICHITPSNPAGNTITVGSASSVAAHRAHGDYVGTCVPSSTSNCQQTCNDAYAACSGAAAGDPDIIAVCAAQLSACLSFCS